MWAAWIMWDYVTLGTGGPVKSPGLGVSKDLDAVGDLFITGIVGSGEERGPADAPEHPAVCGHASGRLH